MTIPEFKEKLQTLHQTLFPKKPLANQEVEQNYFEVLSPFVASPNDNVYPFLAHWKESESSIEFILNNRPADYKILKRPSL